MSSAITGNAPQPHVTSFRRMWTLAGDVLDCVIPIAIALTLLVGTPMFVFGVVQ
jgi:hypothetical protein